MAEVLVVGSINMDLVVKTDEIPKIGETLLGNELLQIPGGKGANQGAAIAKLKNHVTFLGKVGNDVYADVMLKSMEDSGVDVSHIERCNTNTGIAVINVDKHGNNNIVVISGANGLVDKDYLQSKIDVFKSAKIVLFQLEIPIDSVKEGLIIAKNLGKTTILNPAPAKDLDDEIINNVDILIPNEHELQRLSKIMITNDESLLEASKVMLNKGIKQIIVTLGSRGVLYVTKDEHCFFEAYKVDAVDTTAAGDSFIGGFTAMYIKGSSIEESITRGQAAAALAVQKIGAQSSLPTLEEVEAFIINKQTNFREA